MTQAGESPDGIDNCQTKMNPSSPETPIVEDGESSNHRRNDPRQRLIDELLEFQRLQRRANDGTLPPGRDAAAVLIGIGMQMLAMLPEIVSQLQNSTE